MREQEIHQYIQIHPEICKHIYENSILEQLDKKDRTTTKLEPKREPTPIHTYPQIDHGIVLKHWKGN